MVVVVGEGARGALGHPEFLLHGSFAAAPTRTTEPRLAKTCDHRAARTRVMRSLSFLHFCATSLYSCTSFLIFAIWRSA